MSDEMEQEARDLQDALEPVLLQEWQRVTGWWPPEVCTLNDPHRDKVLSSLAWKAAQTAVAILNARRS